MAGFRLHFITSATLGGLVGTTLLQGHLIEPHGLLVGLFLTTLGGILPDIDADHSTPLAFGMTLAAMIIASLVMFSQTSHYNSLELVALWSGCFLFCKLTVFALITRLTTHRGIFHSIPAAALGGLITVLLLYHSLAWSDRLAWLGGCFLGLGYLLHLLLDEITSFNLLGLSGIRHSLGSALKLKSSDPIPTIGVYLAILLILPHLPGAHGLWHDLSSLSSVTLR
ncbi:MAG: metal-dependent hydrolase [Magnetococcales bacterium]|nr:metal-dependent hydrolase [Magnetococcales bacterium]